MEESEEKWDDFFLGETKEPLTLAIKGSKREDQSSNTDVETVKSGKKSSFRDDLRVGESMDDIPNIGLEGIDVTDFAGAGDFISQRRNKDFGQSSNVSSGSENGAKLGRIPSSSCATTNISRTSFNRSDSDLPRPIFHDTFSSHDNDSNQLHGSDFGSDEDDEDEDEDWDREIEERNEFSHPSMKEPTIKQKYIAPNITHLSSAIQEKGSLLEFLETNLREKFSRDLLEPTSSDPVLDYSKKRKSDEWNIFIDDEEVDSFGVTNQHLRGLTEWIHSTSHLLNSYVCIENSNSKCNARTLMESEVQVFNSDVFFIEQVLERCEQEPTKESCIYSMEVIVKWIRGICHQKITDRNDSASHMHQKFSFVRDDPPSSSQEQAPVTWDRLEQLFTRCDYILNEQSKYTVAQILELISFLREELNAISIGLNDRQRGLTGNRGHVVRDVIHFLCNQISLSRIHVYMLEIKSHINFFDRNLALHLESLEVIWDELEAIKSWLSTVDFFLPPPKADLKTSSTDSSAIFRDPALNLQSHPKFEEAMRAAIQEEIKIALSSNVTTSIHYHRFNQVHGMILNKMLIELQACCLANKLFLLSEISSITFQKLESKSPTRKAHVSSFFGGKKSLEISSKYNVVYEISIGSQFVDLMVKLESPSIVRSKLAFAACCYLQCLLKDSLPWQSAKFHRIVLKKRNADGFNILKRGDSELGFGVDGDDIDYYIEDYSTVELERIIIGTFSSALGSIDEVKNLQSLLYEAAFDLFPHLPMTQQSDNNDPSKKVDEVAAKKKSRKKVLSDYLFGHVTTSLDISLSIHEKIKEKSPAGSPPRTPRKSARYYNRLGKSNSGDGIGSGPVHKRIQDFIPSRNKSRHLTYLMKYELFLFSFSLLSQFVFVINDTAPNLSLELFELVARIAAHLDKRQELSMVQRRAFLFAVKLGRNESAIKHGRYLFDNMVEATANEATLSDHLDLNELIFVADVLCDQYALNAQNPLAIKVIITTLTIVLKEQKKQKLLDVRIDYRSSIDRLLLKLGKAYLNLGNELKAIAVFKQAFSFHVESEMSVTNFEGRIVFLSWLFQCFYQLRDTPSAEQVVSQIKLIRSEHILKFLSEYCLADVAKFDESDAAVRAARLNKQRELKFRRRLSNDETDDSADLSRESISSSFTNVLHHALTHRLLLNRSPSALPHYCVADQNIDLGVFLSRIYNQTGHWMSSLQQLAPVIICEEFLVGGKSGSIDGMIELANLYQFRGQIQLDACRKSSSGSNLSFPFEIGSPALTSAMQLLTSSVGHLIGKGKQNKKQYYSPHMPRKRADSPGLGKRTITGSTIIPVGTNKSRTIHYNNLADLLWDAMKWFRRAFDLFHAAGDQINAARSANFIAECNLLPTFIPHIFFNVPLNVAIDLSLYQNDFAGQNRIGGLSPPSPSWQSHGAEQNRKGLSPEPTNSSTKPPLPGVKSALSGATVVKRFVSLEEVEKVSLFALEKFLEAYVCPIELIQSYLHLAEMMLITGNVQDSLHFWWEAKDLFLHLYVDGCCIPLLRVCTLDYMEKLLNILNRIVRFLWKWDKNIKNTHLNLLEIQNYAVLESRRLKKMNEQKIHKLLDDAILNEIVSLIARGSYSDFIRDSKFFRKSAPKADRGNSEQKRKSLTVSLKNGFNSIFSGLYRHGRNTVPERASLTRPESLSSAARRREFDAISLEEWLKEFEAVSRTSDFAFCLEITSNLVSDRLMDFGWSSLVEYNLSALNSHTYGQLSTSASRDDHIRATYSTDTNSSILSPKRSFRDAPPGDGKKSQKMKSKEKDSFADVVLRSLKNSSINNKQIPKYLRPFILTWGDVNLSEANEDANESSQQNNNSSSGHFSKFIAARDNSSAQNPQNTLSNRSQGSLSGSEILQKSEFHSHDPESKFSLANDPLVSILLNEKPLDPFYDFDWMDDTYSIGYSSSLFESSHKSYNLLGNIPELTEKISRMITSGDGSWFSADSLRDIENIAEKLFITRIWHLIMRNSNFVDSRLSSSFSFNIVGKLMRFSLSRVSHNMLRLKAFSRQYKGNIMSFEILNSLLERNFDPKQFGNDSEEPADHSQLFPHLQYRLPKLIYMQNVENLILAYHPYSGKEFIQLLGSDQASSLAMARNSSFYRSISPISSGSNSQSNYDLVSKYSGNNVSAAAIKSSSLHTTTDRVMGNSHAEGIATCDSFSTTLSECQIPTMQLSSQSLRLLYDLCTQKIDSQCAGGLENRAVAFKFLRDHEVHSILDFIRSCSDIDFSSAKKILQHPEDSVGYSSFYRSEAHQKVEDAENPIHIANKSSSDPIQSEEKPSLRPKQSIPVTLICGELSQSIPWEGILANEYRVIRNIGLLPLILQILEPKNSIIRSNSPAFSPLSGVLASSLLMSGSNDSTFNAAPANSARNSASKLAKNYLLGEDQNAYNSYNSSSSSPSISSHLQHSRLRETDVRGYLGPGKVQVPLYLAVSSLPSGLSASVMRDLHRIVDRSEMEKVKASLLKLRLSNEETSSFEKYVETRLQEMESIEPTANKDEKSLKTLMNYQKLLMNNSPVSGDFPVSPDFGDVCVADGILEHEMVPLTYNLQSHPRFDEFWLPFLLRLHELNSRKRYFTSNQHKHSIPMRKPMNEDEENIFLSKIYLMEATGNFTAGLSASDFDKLGSDVLYYPILFVALSELLNMSDALTYLYCKFHRSIVVVFVPHFVLDHLIVEIKSAFDHYESGSSRAQSSVVPGSSDKTESQASTPTGGPYKSLDRKSYIREKQEQLLSAYKQDTSKRKVNHSTSRSGKSNSRSPSKSAQSKAESPDPEAAVAISKDRSDSRWTFQILLNVIEKVQKEKMVPITLFI